MDWSVAGCLETTHWVYPPPTSAETCISTSLGSPALPFTIDCLDDLGPAYSTSHWHYDETQCGIAYEYHSWDPEYESWYEWQATCDDQGEWLTWASSRSDDGSTWDTEQSHVYTNTYDEAGHLVHREDAFDYGHDEPGVAVEDWTFEGDLVQTWVGVGYEYWDRAERVYGYDDADRLIDERFQEDDATSGTWASHTTYAWDDLDRGIGITADYGDDGNVEYVYTYAYLGDSPWTASLEVDYGGDGITDVTGTSTYDCPATSP